MRTITQRLYYINELEEIAQKRAINDNRYWNVRDGYWMEGDWLLDSEIFAWDDVVEYDFTAQGGWIQFPKLEVKDETKFFQLLGIPESLQGKLKYSFPYFCQENTMLHYDSASIEDRGELEILEEACAKFAEVMQQAMMDLRAEAEDLTSDKTIKAFLQANEYEFYANGRRYREGRFELSTSER